jgi:hypothetical protein
MVAALPCGIFSRPGNAFPLNQQDADVATFGKNQLSAPLYLEKP